MNGWIKVNEWIYCGCMNESKDNKPRKRKRRMEKRKTKSFLLPPADGKGSDLFQKFPHFDVLKNPLGILLKCRISYICPLCFGNKLLHDGEYKMNLYHL